METGVTSGLIWSSKVGSERGLSKNLSPSACGILANYIYVPKR
jgi:hypothetical protein